MWAGVGLALVSYLLLHAVASQPVVAATQVGQMGAMVRQTLWKSFASVGQLGFPIVCLAAAAMSAWERKQRQRLISNVTESPASNALDGMSWREFEIAKLVKGFVCRGIRLLKPVEAVPMRALQATRKDLLAASHQHEGRAVGCHILLGAPSPQPAAQAGLPV